MRKKAETPTPSSQRRVAAYLRVSTGRQAEADLSIPDQRHQTQAYCAARDWTLIEFYEDAGASGTDDDRPEFQRMMSDATSSARPFDVILVHSTSRFARNVLDSEFNIRRLRRANVILASMTQEISGDDGHTSMVRQILSVFDEHQSAEISKHTHRAMKENARQGFQNGSVAPFGYAKEDAETRGIRIKKKLVIHPGEAAVVRRIFSVHLGERGMPMGVKAIAALLNSEGETLRGRRFSTSNVHRILTNEAYIERQWFNRLDTRKQLLRPREEWIEVEVPHIVDADVFQRAQDSLQERAPNRTPARLVSTPVLLTQLAVCASCNSRMMLRTGKSGRYRYYTCASAALRGKGECLGRSVPMAELDSIVMDAFADRILNPDRMKELLAAYLSKGSEAEANRQAKTQKLKAAAKEAADVKARLLKLVMAGGVEADDPAVVQRMQEATRCVQHANYEINAINGRSTQETAAALTPERLSQIAGAVRKALHEGDPQFRRAYLRLFVDRVIVGDGTIEIAGSSRALLAAAND